MIRALLDMLAFLLHGGDEGHAKHRYGQPRVI